MTSLIEDIERVDAILSAQGLTTSIDQDRVHVRVDYSADLVVEVGFDPYGKWYTVTLLVADRTGGIEIEDLIASVRLEQLPAVIQSWIDARAREVERDEELMRDRPED